MLTMKDKKKLTIEVQNRYAKGTKARKSKILDEFTAITKYNRNYAARILRLMPGKVIGYARDGNKRVVYCK
jgi:DNA-directed RNA polymerase subunit F